MFRYSLFVSLTTVVLLAQNRLAAAECHTDSECRKQNKTSPYCCKSSFHSWAPHECYSTCAGKACDSDSDCGGIGGGCCNTGYGNNCTTKKSCLKTCNSNSDCSDGTYCCKGLYFVKSVCASSCVGKPCGINSDCGAPNECCSSGGECTKVDCHGSPLPVWLIAVFVTVAVLVVVGLVIIIYCWCFARSSSTGPQSDPLLKQPLHSTNYFT